MTDAVSEPLLLLGDCLDRLREMDDNSVDSVVTDPPYGLSFMGKKWDYDVPSEEIWRECLRVLKPGGHLLAFAGTRTQHRMAVRIEDAGFEIRDMIAWVYGSGFPKSLDVSKAIDKAAGYKRTTEYEPNHKNSTFGKGMGGGKHGAHSDPPATVEANQWKGFGTALKPALEPVTVARKPLGEKTVAANVLKHGTGALNIDGCRVEGKPRTTHADGNHVGDRSGKTPYGFGEGHSYAGAQSGRWPANLIHDGSEEVLAGSPNETHRFFYAPKASKKDRDEGCEGFDAKATAFGNQAQAELKRGNLDHDDGKNGMNKVKMRQNSHPTVKPTDLMRYLCRLVTPPEGIVLDPFMGSGSTGKAAVLEGFQFIGVERDEEYMKIAESRIAAAVKSAANESA